MTLPNCRACGGRGCPECDRQERAIAFVVIVLGLVGIALVVGTSL
jgi:uncharacterized protein (UPF0212 family)